MSLNRLVDKRIALQMQSKLGMNMDELSDRLESIDPETGGVAGPAGPPGKSLHSGLGPPQNSLGRAGDTYFDVQSGNVYLNQE